LQLTFLNQLREDLMATAFERLAATLDYPVYIVTAAAQDKTAGCLVGFATQCSIHPPRFLACISEKNRTLEIARGANVLAVHIIGEKDREIAEIFGGETSDEVDKFARVRWHYAHGAPILDDCESWFAGSVLERIDLGDHVGFLLEPIDTEQDATSEQLTYQQARDIEPGHKP
jgi:flavin reductase (DIM6/NTAB) family NADH-FMN oxidoreductase RutF